MSEDELITRTAIFEGRIKPGSETPFWEAIEQRLAPLWRQFPNALEVRWGRATERDADSPPIVLIQQVDYPSRAALDEAIASPIRSQARAITLELMEMFEGRFYHVVCEGHVVQGS
jgi:hypothetical protein